jgi:hypothetical protein
MFYVSLISFGVVIIFYINLCRKSTTPKNPGTSICVEQKTSDKETPIYWKIEKRQIRANTKVKSRKTRQLKNH